MPSNRPPEVTVTVVAGVAVAALIDGVVGGVVRVVGGGGVRRGRILVKINSKFRSRSVFPLCPGGRKIDGLTCLYTA